MREFAIRTIASAAVMFTAALAVCIPTHAGDAKPKRIVSLNLCTDQLLLDLVSRDSIAGVSYLAADETLSAAATQARGLPLLRGTAEEVLRLKPDLVFAGEYTTSATVGVLRRVGIEVVVVPLASDFDGMRKAIRQMAAAVGEGDRGESVIAAFDQRLAAAQPIARARPTAIAYQVNSLVSGPQSLVDRILDAAGYRNKARDLTVQPNGRVSLEQLIVNPPDLLVLAHGPNDFRTALADNLRHPALQRFMRERRAVHVPMPYWMCATPRILGAIELLASLRPPTLARASIVDR